MASEVQVGSKPTDFIAKGHRARDGFDLFTQYIGGNAFGAIVVECRGTEDALSPYCLGVADEISEFAETLDHVSYVTSLVPRIKRLNGVFEFSDFDHDSIPESRNMVAQLLLSENSDVLSELVTADLKALKLNILFDAYDTSNVIEVRSQLSHFATVLESRRGSSDLGLKISIGGWPFVWAEMIATIGREAGRNASIIAIALFLICSGAFKSIRLGLFSLFPAGTASLFVLGIMGVAGIRIDIANCALAIITGATAVDFYVHLVNGVRYELSQGYMVQEAVVRAVRAVGVPITLDCISNLSFVALLSSSFVPVQTLGVLLCIAMITSLLMTLIVTVSIFTLFPHQFFPGYGKVEQFQRPGKESLAA